MADSDSSSHFVCKTFRQATRERLLHEMLRMARGKDASDWKVLIMDEVTVKVMSCSCKMADITDEGISLVEDLNKRRQPLPALDAVYFIQPKRESVQKLKMDLSGKSPLYKKAHVFFSAPISRDLLQTIKSDGLVLSRIATLREVNLEYLTIDSQAFSTDNGRALEQLFGEHSEGGSDYDACLDTIASRLGTVFASLKEFPVVRYRAARSAAADASTATTFRDLVPTKLAAALWDRLQRYKNSLSDFPTTESCELLIVDRTIDPIAPVIHEWTYDAMCHDLLNMEGNKYVYEVTTSAGRLDRKEVLLEEHDPVWVELRHLHIAAVNKKLDEKMINLKEKNKAAQIRLGSKDGQELSTRDMQKMVQALPQYRDQIEKLSLHIDIATKLNAKIAEYSLRDVGTLEQELVFGDASSKELINILTNQNLTKENKLRLLMIYAASHPEKLDAPKRLQWMKLARLTEDDMHPVVNMEYMGVSISKKSGGFSLKFGNRKNKRGVRKEKNQDEEIYDLSRFYPLIQDVIEDLAKGELSKEDYPYVKEPSAAVLHAMSGVTGSVRSTPTNSKPAQSMRTSKPNSTWASRSKPSDDGQSSESTLRHAHSDPKIMGKRIFVFIIGGATRSELRAVHKLTGQIRREVVLGTTSLDEPHEFLTKLKLLSVLDEVALDELEI